MLTFFEIALAFFTVVYITGILWFGRGLRRLSPTPPDHHESPQPVSIVIAARDESATIDTCLRQLTRQTHPVELCEIIVVDDGSQDDTAARVLAFAKNHASTPTALLSTAAELGRTGSKKAALALGIERAAHEIILTTDADCEIPNAWVASMVAEFYDVDVGMVIGYAQVGSQSERLGKLGGWEAVDFLHLMAAAAGSAAQGHPMAASGQSLGFRRTAFYDVGGYQRIIHRVSGDDVLLLQLMRGSGRWRIRFCASAAARVSHPASGGLASLLARRARWASNAPFQLRLDPVFFAYLACTFATSLCLCLAPAAVWLEKASPTAVAALASAKVACESILAHSARRLFGRRDLARHFALWVLTQPVYILLAGMLGMVGRFRWKGKRYEWGRESDVQAAGSQHSEPSQPGTSSEAIGGVAPTSTENSLKPKLSPP